MGRRVFVAGGSGVIGRVLCRLLVADGWTVFGSTRRADAARELEADRVEPVILDVFDGMAVHETFARVQPDALVHLVTDLPTVWVPAHRAEVLERNARVREVGTRHLIDACRDATVRTVVAQSIAFAYAPGPQPFREETPLDTQAADPVVARTAQAVHVLEQLVLSGPFRGVVLRYGRLYGSGTWTEASPGACAVHVDAAADAARRALITDVTGIFNVAEADGTVATDRSEHLLAWSSSFRHHGG